VTNIPPHPTIDPKVPSSARIWNYWLGGKDNYHADREAGAAFEATFPDIVACARASRAFLIRAVRYLAGEAGIRQFLDVGTGMPAADATHEVAQDTAPQARIVYVDNDPIVLVHAQAMLKSAPEGTTDYIDADLREPGKILHEAARTLDFAEPVAVMLLGILGHIDDDAEAQSIVRGLMAGVPSGSYLVLSDGTNVIRPVQVVEATEDYNDTGAPPYRLRSPGQLADLFLEGLEILEPGLVSAPRWRPNVLAALAPGNTLNPVRQPREVDQFVAVGRKP
jgi:hypothetical protein